MSKYKSLIVVPLVTTGLLLLQACATISYVGAHYTPTDHVDLYFSARDVKREFKTIGHLSEKVGGFSGEEKAKQSIISKAKQVGGDAVIITGIEHVSSNESSGVTDYQKAEVIKYTDMTNGQ